MTILYSCVARGTTVLCSSQTGGDNCSDTIRSMLPNIPNNDGKKTFTSKSYEFHCLIENGLFFICATNAGISKTQPYGFLAEIKKRFYSGPLGSRAVTAEAGEFDRDFNFVLSQQMQKFSQSNIGSNSAVAAVQKQVEEVKGVMSQNIERVLERGDRLEDLMDKSEELQMGAATFKRTSRKIQRRYFWRNKKMSLILCCVIFVIIGVITVIILFSTGVLPPDSDDDKPKPTTTTSSP